MTLTWSHRSIMKDTCSTAIIPENSNNNFSRNNWPISTIFEAIYLISSANVEEKRYNKMPLTAVDSKKLNKN